MRLATDGYYRALVARDRRFDGVFYVGVTSTGIYCRPVCRARTPGRERCRFFNSAAAAERAGFRPCLRCRPELAPGHSKVDAAGRLASAAASRIAEGALNGGDVESLARELGVGSRHLRRVLEREVGVTPVELAQTQRLLLAKRLLTDSDLPVTSVAHASGFQSVRRFNALFRGRYRLNPTELRRVHQARNGSLARIGPNAGEGDGVVRLTLAYRPPFAWEPLLRFLAVRATPGVERVENDRYTRTLRIGDYHGWLAVAHSPDGDALDVGVSASLIPVLMAVLARVRQLFDLDANPQDIDGHLIREGLASLVRRTRGLRVPGAVDGFELAVRAILGQQVSVRGATTLAGRFAAAFGDVLSASASVTRLAPTADRVARTTVEEIAAIGLPRARAASIHALAGAVVDARVHLAAGANPREAVRSLTTLPGIGEWTAQYIAMRALHWPDAFPASDLALRRAAGMRSTAKLARAAERWSPWRAYAAMHLWSTLTPATRAGNPGES